MLLVEEDELEDEADDVLLSKRLLKEDGLALDVLDVLDELLTEERSASESQVKPVILQNPAPVTT